MTLIIALVVGEFFLRAVTPPETFKHHQLYCRYDSLLGWEKIPNTKGEHFTPEYQVVEELNSRGIRGPEYSLEKDSNEYRILVIGDSFAEGYTVNFSALFSEILKARLNQSCQEATYQVINTGTGGYSTDQELLYFQSEGQAFQPNLTILLFCVNDLWYNTQAHYWRGAKPQFKLLDGELRLQNVPVPKPGERSFTRQTKEWLLTNLELMRRLKVLKDKIQYASSGSAVPEEYLPYQKEYNQSLKDGWKLTSALLKTLKEATQEIGSELLVFYIPEKIELYEKDWKDFQATYKIDPENFNLDKARNELQQICTMHEIPFLDPVPDFEKAVKANPNKRLYFETDWHWNANGNELVGQLLYEWVNCKPIK